jgi:hypothetical protein
MENFKTVENFLHYRVLRDGRVQSRYVRSGSGWDISDQWSDLKPSRTSLGYYCVVLHRDGRRFWRLVHQLVLEAFVGPRPPGFVACHKDGDRGNNSVGNLRWDTQKSNLGDRVASGTDPVGERNPASKLKESDVLEIRRLFSQGIPKLRIAKMKKISAKTVRMIINGRLGSHV